MIIIKINACRTKIIAKEKSEKTVLVSNTDLHVQIYLISFYFLESNRNDFELIATENIITEIRKEIKNKKFL